MIGNRRGNINTLPTAKLRPEIKIRVFIVQKEVFIQEADLVKHAPPIQHGSPTGAKHGFGHVEVVSISAQPAIKPDSCSRKSVAGAIHRPDIFENQLRRAYANGAVPQHRLDEVFKPCLLCASVVIDERDVGSLSDFQTGCIPSGKPLVFSERNDLYLGKILSRKADGIVGGAIIDKDDFAIAIALAGKSTEAIFEKSFTIPVDNNNADLSVFFPQKSSSAVNAPYLTAFSRLRW